MLAGCSLAPVSGLPPQFDVEVKNSSRGAIDLGIARDSEAMHRFLTGQLSYINEDFSAALKNLGRASELISEPQPELHFRLAELYLKSAEVDKALGEVTLALEGDGNNPRYLLMQAGLLEAAGREDEAVPVYEKLISLEKDRFEGYLGLASLYIRDGQDEKALEVAQQFVRTAPGQSVAYVLLSRLREDREELAEAAAVLERRMADSPDDIEAAISLVRVYLKQEKFAQVRSLVSGLVEKSPANSGLKQLELRLQEAESLRDELLAELRISKALADESGADARFRLATLEIQNQNATDALLNLSIVLAEDPSRDEARYYLASIYAAAGRRKEAIEELLKIGSGSEMYIRAGSFAALLLREDGRLQDAEVTMRSVLEEDPANRRLLAFLVLILREEKKFDEAAALMRKAIDDNPLDDGLLFQYAVLLHDSGNEDEAMRTMRRVIEINPENSDALNYIAYTLAENAKDLELARSLAQKALQLKPGDGYYIDTLGWIYYKSGNYAAAEPLLKQAVDISDQDVVIMEHYADCLVKLGRQRQALEIYRMAFDKATGSSSHEEREALKRIEKKLQEIKPGIKGKAAVK